MKVEINGNIVEIINATNENVNEYLDFILSLSNDEDNYTLTRYSEIDKNKILEWSKSWGNQTTMILAQTNQVVGFIQLIKGKYFGMERQFHVGEIAYAVRKDFRGKGLIYVIFNELLRAVDVKILTAWVDSRNIRSQRLLQNLGFNRDCEVDSFMWSVKEKKFIDLIFYRSRTEKAVNEVKRQLEKFSLTIR
jgi:RimJ/RimL family protein N-acetyltransferase